MYSLFKERSLDEEIKFFIRGKDPNRVRTTSSDDMHYSDCSRESVESTKLFSLDRILRYELSQEQIDELYLDIMTNELKCYDNVCVFNEKYTILSKRIGKAYKKLSKFLGEPSEETIQEIYSSLSEKDQKKLYKRTKIKPNK